MLAFLEDSYHANAEEIATLLGIEQYRQDRL